MQPEVTDLGQLVHHAVEDARPLIEARRLSLNIRLPGGRAHVYADPQRFTQALTGLLDFAARRADEGGAIALTAEEADGTAAIHVTVDGLVLPDADAASLFELFAVTAGDPTRSAGGLTLPLVRELLVRQGGAVDVDADDNATRFSLRLPVYDPATRPAAEGDRRRLNGHRRVLVIDRDPDTAASLSMLLQLQGHDVRVANDRRAAIPAAQAFHPDTVMIDSAAAEGGPGELVRALRLLPETAHAALLCLSADAADDPAREALFDHYLLKPVEPHLLQRLLAQTSPTVH
jgi:two-component system, sensor histidine kinase